MFDCATHHLQVATATGTGDVDDAPGFLSPPAQPVYLGPGVGYDETFTDDALSSDDDERGSSSASAPPTKGRVLCKRATDPRRRELRQHPPNTGTWRAAVQERKCSRRARERERGRRDPFLVFFAPARPFALALAVGQWPTLGWTTSLLVGFGPCEPADSL